MNDSSRSWATRPLDRHLWTAARVSAFGAAATCLALAAWSEFLSTPGRYLGPVLVVAAVVVGVGVLARRVGTPPLAAFGAQLLVGVAGASQAIAGSPIPLGSAWTRLVTAFRDASSTAAEYAPPVPAEVPGVEPFLIAGGVGCLLLVELLAVVAGRAPLAGLPLLVILTVPLSILDDGPRWWVFASTAVAYLAMMAAQQDQRVAGWGRDLDHAGRQHRAAAWVRHPARTRARALGATVIALAVLAPAVVPTLSFAVFGIGPGRGGGGEIGIKNPVVDLRRDLIQGEDNDLLVVTTNDPEPSYLRISVLNRFSADAWSPGDRRVPTSQRASGPMPALEGVDEDVLRVDFDYDLAATDLFSSTWLPTAAHVTDIEAPGDWRYDLSTRDFLASSEDLTTRGARWSFGATELRLNAEELADIAPSVGLVSRELTDLPDTLAPEIRELALAVTQRGQSQFERAVLLQSWFRGGGGFVYDVTRARGSSGDDLLAFLSDGPGGRTGYCEQFAASMAVMARILGIPARVAIGFLRPTETAPGTWVYSAHDLHAWPELFFPGAGWVRFEPTPSARVSEVPRYTTANLTPDPIVEPSTSTSAPSPSASIREPRRDDAQAAPPVPEDAETESGRNWLPLAVAALVVAGLILTVFAPRALRRTRRTRRLEGGVEDVWDEIRDTALDLGLDWPEARSPHETATALTGWFGLPPDEFTPQRPLRGPQVNPAAVAAIDRIVLALEISRYAERNPGPDGSWHDDGAECLASLIGGSTAATRRRAEWVPRSLLARTPAPSAHSADSALADSVGPVG
jgi:transglutaminase-like putative cysteine protease